MLPMPNETLGSYLTRWAWACGEEPASLSHRLGLGYFVWRQDLDRSLSQTMLCTIAQAVGVEVSVIQDMTYCAWLALAKVPVQRSGFQPWLTPVGLYHRRRLRFGQLFCPLCLKEDTHRHVHLEWRIASSWICTRHKVCLMDCCPNCGACFAPYRNDSLMLGRCERCAFPLYTAHPSSCSTHQVELQEYVNAIWHQAAEGNPLPLAWTYSEIKRVAKSSPEFIYAGEPWSFWRVLQRGQLLEIVLASEVLRKNFAACQSNFQRLYTRESARTRVRPRTCWVPPEDPQERAKKIMQIALRLHPKRSMASRVRKK